MFFRVCMVDRGNIRVDTLLLFLPSFLDCEITIFGHVQQDEFLWDFYRVSARRNGIIHSWTKRNSMGR